MKRYLTFHNRTYYPSCGMDDFVMDFDNKDEAIEFIVKHAIENSNYESEESIFHFCSVTVWDSETRTNIFNR